MLGLSLFFIVFFGFAFRIYKKKGLTPSFFLYALYSLSGFAAVILVLFYGWGENPYVRDYNEGALFLLFALLLFLQPFMEMKDDNIKSITLPSEKVLRPFVLVLTILSCFSIAYFAPIAQSMLFVDIGNVASLRNAVARGEHPFITESIFNTIAGTAASFYVLQLLFFFLLLLKQKRMTFWAVIVLLSSLSYPIFVLAYLGRDGVLFWFFTFISYLLLFYRNLPVVVMIKLKKIAIIMTIPFVAIFLMITIGRFVVGGNSDGVLYPSLSYLGQGPVNFSEFYDTGVKEMGFGSSIFPLFFASTEDIGYLLERFDIKTWVFKTFMSTIYSDFGVMLTLLIGGILILLFRIFYRNDKQKCNMSFSFLILFSLFFTVYSQGVFYFRQYNRVGNLFIVIMLLLAFASNFLPKKKFFL